MPMTGTGRIWANEIIFGDGPKPTHIGILLDTGTRDWVHIPFKSKKALNNTTTIVIESLPGQHTGKWEGWGVTNGQDGSAFRFFNNIVTVMGTKAANHKWTMTCTLDFVER